MINNCLKIIKENIEYKEITVDGVYYSDNIIDTAKEKLIKVRFTDMTGGK